MSVIDVDVVATPPILVDVIEAAPIIMGVVGGVGPAGPVGPVGPMGPSGTNVVAVPHDEWPPAAPLPNTLYLRLAP